MCWSWFTLQLSSWCPVKIAPNFSEVQNFSPKAAMLANPLQAGIGLQAYHLSAAMLVLHLHLCLYLCLCLFLCLCCTLCCRACKSAAGRHWIPPFCRPRPITGSTHLPIRRHCSMASSLNRALTPSLSPKLGP